MRLESISYSGLPLKTWFSKHSMPRKVKASLYSIPQGDKRWRYYYRFGPLNLLFTSLKKPPPYTGPSKGTYFGTGRFRLRDNWRTRVIISRAWHKPSRDTKNFGRTWNYWRFGPVTVIRRSRPKNFDPKTAPLQTYEKVLIVGLVVFYAWLLSGVFA